MIRFNHIKSLPLYLTFSPELNWETFLPLVPTAVAMLTSLVVLLISSRCTKSTKKGNLFSQIFQTISGTLLEIAKLFSTPASPMEAQQTSLKPLESSTQSEKQQEQPVQDPAVQEQPVQEQPVQDPAAQVRPIIQSIRKEITQSKCKFFDCPFYNPDSLTHCNEASCVFALSQLTINDEKH